MRQKIQYDSEKKHEEYEQRTKHALTILEEVSQDNMTPRNIRRAVTDSINSLKNTEFRLALRVANAINILDEILQDVNMSAYTRVKLWNVMSLIETIKD